MPQPRQLPYRSGFTLVELLVLIAVVGILIGMMLPSVRRSRGTARRSECSNHIRQISLAFHNYQDAYKCLPPTMGIFDENGRFVEDAKGETSSLVGILAFLDHQAILDQITTAAEYNGVKYPANIVSPTDENYAPWQTRISSFECPNDRKRQSRFGRTNFAFSIGDTARDLYQNNPRRGAFSTQEKSNLESIIDGTSNTVMFVEVCGSPRKPTISSIVNFESNHFLNDPSQLEQLYDETRTGFNVSAKPTDGWRGKSWADGMAASTLANTIVPPNGISCAVDASRNSDGVYTAGSSHSDGANVTYVDGSTHFITNSVDVGDPSASTLSSNQLKKSKGIPSPHGVWGALGSANGNDHATNWSN